MRRWLPAVQLMMFTYPILGYCTRHPREEVVVRETNKLTGEVKSMCKTCWDAHRGRTKL